jgi:hypothetical protein
MESYNELQESIQIEIKKVMALGEQIVNDHRFQQKIL